MKLGLLIYGSLETISGGYLYDRQLVKYLRGVGHSVEIISIPWRSYPLHLTDNFSNSLFTQLAALQVDLLIQDELNHPSLFWINRKLRSYVKYPIFSLVHHLRISENHPTVLKPIYRAIEHQFLQSVDGFVYNSATTRQTVETLIGNKKPAIIIYPSGSHCVVPNSPWLHEATTLRQQQSQFRLIFVGNLIERKGLHTVLAGLEKMPAEIDWRLDVVGNHEADRNYSAKIRSQIERAGIKARITLHGSISDAHLAELLKQAHLLAVPSYEGFGIVYLEAMAHGVPVIASSAGAAGEIVEHGNNGYLIDPGDSEAITQHIAQLAQDHTRWGSMSLAARQRFDSHPTWEQSFATLESWFQVQGSRFKVRG